MSDRHEEDEHPVDPPSGDPPLPRWVGRPAVRYPGIALIWGTVLAFLTRDGDTVNTVWSLAFITASATVLWDLAVRPPTDELEWTGGFWVAGLLVVASIFAQLCSMTDAWPDRWRPRLATPQWKQQGRS